MQNASKNTPCVGTDLFFV